MIVITHKKHIGLAKELCTFVDDLNIKTNVPSRRQNRDVDISGFMDMHSPMPRDTVDNFGNQDYLQNVMRVAK